MCKQDIVYIVAAQHFTLIRHAHEQMKINRIGTFELFTESQQSIGSSYPQHTFFVEQHTTCLIATFHWIRFQIIARVYKTDTSITLLFDVIDTSTESNNPDTTVAVFTQVVHIVMAQAIDIVGIVSIMKHLISASLRYQLNDSVSFRSNPDIFFRILYYLIGRSSERSASK